MAQDALQSEGERFRQFRNENLFNPFSRSPELADRQFKAVKYLDRTLAKYPWYQGLSVFGSTLFGYGSVESPTNEQSDIDIFIMVDSSHPDYKELVVLKTLRAEERRIPREFAIDANIQPVVNVARMYEATTGPVMHASDVNIMALEALSYWSTQDGSKRHPGAIRQWREKYRALCDSLTPRERGALRQRLLTNLTTRDSNREPKIEARIPGYAVAPSSEKSKTTRARLNLWSTRVNTLFGL